MIKIVFCLRRKPELSAEEFQRYWLEDHAQLVRKYGATLGVRRYTQSHSFDDPRIAASITARGSHLEPYDGVAELWWDSVEDIVAAGATEEGRAAGRALLEDERTFIDLANSPIFYAQEHVILT
ncbi:EthD domain-containing protein [Mycobacterium sp.]|uniref:EthD domain-containing protein n=1 Tax=Mycobacterium sp. TaxID=1785 RepID=UPI003BAF5300